MSTQVKAWFLDFGADQFGAIATHELIELIEQPKFFHVPAAPSYCRDTLIWEEKILPVAYFNTATSTQAHQIAIVAAQLAPYEPLRYGAFILYSSPSEIAVEDAMACSLPKEHKLLNTLAISCFSHQGKPVPIIDISRIFFIPQ